MKDLSPWQRRAVRLIQNNGPLGATVLAGAMKLRTRDLERPLAALVRDGILAVNAEGRYTLIPKAKN